MNAPAWTVGRCWLYCRRTGLPVMWVGSAQTAGVHAPLYACDACLSELSAMVWQHLQHKDLRDLTRTS